ncbi:MAG: hypothetical protein IPM48_02610 [Saprospiraceae bacterium]|nr:hypothetical protein [Saprospiraceae bacterium]
MWLVNSYRSSNLIDTEKLPAGLYHAVIYECGVVVRSEKIVILKEF